MRNHIKRFSQLAFACFIAMFIAGCGLGAAGIAALVSAGVTGVGAGFMYYEANAPSPAATPSTAATAMPSPASTPSASASSTISK